MKKARFLVISLFISLLLLALCAGALADVPIDEAHFPDKDLRLRLAPFDADGNSILSDQEISGIRHLYLTPDNTQGVEYLTALEHLECTGAFSSLDISKNKKLEWLVALSPNLSKLDLTGNPYLTEAWLEGTHAADEAANEYALEAYGETGQSLTLRCYRTVTVVPGPSTALPVDAAHFPDAAFRAAVSAKFDADQNGRLNLYERTHSADGEDHSFNCSSKGIASLDGLDDLEGITELNAAGNKIASLDLRGNKSVAFITLDGNPLKTLLAAGNPRLETIYAAECKLTGLDLSGCSAMVSLDLHDNALTSLNVAGCPKLLSLEVSGNKLKSLNVSGSKDLCILTCMDNQLSKLNLSSNKYLLATVKHGDRSEGYYHDFSRPCWLYDYTPATPFSYDYPTWYLYVNQDVTLVTSGGDGDSPDAPTVGALKYKLSGSNAAVTGPADPNAKKLTIPSTVKSGGKTYKVTEIKAGAFKGMKKLTSVTIGANVKTIGKGAFQSCAKLKTITLKTKKLTSSSVKSNAFKGIYKKATFKCPSGKKDAYKKLLLKKGAPKTCKFK